MTTDSGSQAKGIHVETEDSGPVARLLKVEVDASRVRKAFDRTYKGLARSAQVRGFRRGKVPRSVLEKLYGPSVAEDLERQLVAETLPEAVELAELEPVSEPDIESDSPTPGEAFRYSARIEIKPEVALPELSGLPARKPPVEVSDSEVEEQLQQLRERNAPLVEEPAEASAENGHIVNVDFVGRIDGEAFEGGSAKDSQIELGSGQMIPGFEEQLVGARAGDDLQVRVTFPEDYRAEALRAKEAVFDVHVGAIRRRDLPELDDEFAKDLGEFESLDDLRTRIRSDILDGRDREARSVLRRTLMDSLIERTEFEVPPGMVERQLQSQMRSLHNQFHGQLPDEVVHAQLARMQEEGRPAAERRVREALLLEAVAEARDLQVADGDVDARLAEMAEERGMDAHGLIKTAQEQGFYEAVRGELRDDRTLDSLIAEAKVEESTDT